MNSCILVVVEIPTSETPLGLLRDYQHLLASPRTKPLPNSGIEKLAENVWLIPLNGGLLFLGGLLHELEAANTLKFHTLQLGKDWSWLGDKPDKSTPS
jgi:hypothetical protein